MQQVIHLLMSILLMFDHHFESVGKPHTVVKAETIDRNHFDPNYIPQGRFLAKPHWNLQELAFKGALHASKLYDFNVGTGPG